jgi:hypothetical protein
LPLTLFGSLSPRHPPRGQSGTDSDSDERNGEGSDSRKGEFVALNQFLQAVQSAGSAGDDGFLRQVALEVHS